MILALLTVTTATLGWDLGVGCGKFDECTNGEGSNMGTLPTRRSFVFGKISSRDDVVNRVNSARHQS